MRKKKSTRNVPGPLHGVPIAVKDLCYTKGVRTMAGTSIYAASSQIMTRRCHQSEPGRRGPAGNLNLTEGAMEAIIRRATFLSIREAKICGLVLLPVDPGWRPLQVFATAGLEPIREARSAFHRRPTEL